jgi:iron complex outermembrane receptor protein
MRKLTGGSTESVFACCQVRCLDSEADYNANEGERMASDRNLLSVIVSASVLLEGYAGAATAQEGTAAAAGDTLQEIVVTAQKRAENIQRVPIAITPVTPERLEVAGVTSPMELGNVVSGLKLLNIGGQISPRIRGIGSTSIAPGQEAPVAVVVDGVYYASNSDVSADLTDVSQISVLKGPQGTLFGRNATGGVIQIATRDPGQELELDLSTALDNYETWRTSAFIGGRIREGVLGSFSAQYVTQGQGWGQNIFNGEDVHRIDDDLSLRSKLVFSAGEDTTIRLAGDFMHRKGSLSGVYTVFPGFVQAYASPVPERRWDINSYIQPRNEYSGGGASLTVEHDFSAAKLTSITAWRRSTQFWQFNPAVTAVPSLDLALDDFSRQLTQEVQLVSTADSRLTWALGAFYIHTLAGQEPQLINLRGPFRGPGPFAQILSDTDQKLDSLAGFAQATYRLTGSTRLTGGVRYTHEKKELSGTQFGVLDNGNQVSLIAPGGSTLTASKPTWRIAIDQDLAPDVVGYLSYNRGFKSGGFNVRDRSNPPFAPEQLDAYELGVKSLLFDDRLRLNTAAFYYDYQNVQVARYTTTTVIYNGARAKLYGFDIDGEARLFGRLNVTGGISYLHSEFTDFPNAVSSSYVPSALGSKITLFTQSASGKRLPFSPELTYNLGLDYKIPTAIGAFTLDASDSYSAKFYSEPDNLLTQRAYHYLNASVAWRSMDARYGVRAYINNILNEAVSSQFGSLASGYEADYPSPPQTYGVRFQYSF